MSEKKRKKILVLSDHPLLPSGVGIQTKMLIEGLLNTGDYKFVCLGGAISHPDMSPQMVAPEVFGDNNWVIYPVVGHGNKDMLRKFLHQEKPDAVLLVTDPRFFTWVWEMEDEIRSYCPINYWHVWDADPTPLYNKDFYNSTDAIGCISRKTYGIMQDLGHSNYDYIPHALPKDLFKPLDPVVVEEFKRKNYDKHADKKFIVMWNNRNARRKMTGDVIACFSKFAHRVGKKNVTLVMHTAVHDTEGQNINELAKQFDIEDCLIISEERVPAETINCMYNVADVTLNIANAEGFGLSSLESLYAGTLIINNMTGGLQYQIGDWHVKIKDFTNQAKLETGSKKRWKNNVGKWFGVPVFPAARTCTGSQQIPYIYADYINHEDVVKALVKIYNMPKVKRDALGLEAREWALENFGMDNMINKWDNLFTKTIKNFKVTAVRYTTL